MEPTFLSLFAGIGGFDLALERTGFRCIGQIEIDPFCRRVLAARFPHAPCWLDCREFTGDGLQSPPNLLVGGFPCQGVSVAGKRRGLQDERTALFWEIIRIQKIVQAPWGLFENVPGLLSSGQRADFLTVLEALREGWPVVGYRILDSRYFGVPQRRRRVFFVCGPTEAGVAQVLFEPEGGAGHPAAGQEAGADVAHALAVGTGSGGYRYDANGEDYIVTATLNSGGNTGGFRTEPGEHLIAHTLRAEGADASEDGTGRGVPLVVAHSVRRLTPTECARLQGFPDGWCCLCQPLEAWATDPDTAAERCRCPDGPQYRAYGNAVTVPVVEWLGRRLRECLT